MLFGSGSDFGTYLKSACATFGFVVPAAAAGSNAVVIVSESATDYAGGISGFTTVVFANQFGSAYDVTPGGITGGSPGTIDPRPKAGNGLAVASAGGPYPNDLFGTPFTTSAGAIQYQSASVPTGIINGGVGGPVISN